MPRVSQYSKVYISDQLIISRCHTLTGSGGVKRWNQRTARKVVVTAQATAPVGDYLNHDNYHFFWRPTYVPGCYRRGFRSDNISIGHRNFSRVGNICPHALWVEKGRESNRGSPRKELYSWARFPGDAFESRGTGGFRGIYFLYPLAKSIYTASKMKSVRSRRAGSVARSIFGF